MLRLVLSETPDEFSKINYYKSENFIVLTGERNGLKNNKSYSYESEDVISVKSYNIGDEEYRFLILCDGHGANGARESADICSKMLPTFIIKEYSICKNIKQSIKKGFEYMDIHLKLNCLNQFDNSGTTATLA
ncbi:5331_t:CDS:2, partial [Scutellospora calospora]